MNSHTVEIAARLTPEFPESCAFYNVCYINCSIGSQGPSHMNTSHIDLSGKRIVVTGASRGLGRAMAVAFVRHGARVLLTATDEVALAEVLDECLAGPGSAVSLLADVTLQHDLDRIVERAGAELGGVDVLVNNAGISVGSLRKDFWQRPIRFWEVTMKDYRRFFEINTFSALQLSCSLAPAMVQNGWGRIINITTSLDTMLRPGMAPYGGSKSALEALTAIMGGDLAGTGVTANVITPGGPADTRMVPAEMGLPREALIPAEAMVAPAVWLASTESDDTTSCRFLAASWDTSAPLEQAVAAAKSPAAWMGYGTKATIPGVAASSATTAETVHDR